MHIRRHRLLAGAVILVLAIAVYSWRVESKSDPKIRGERLSEYLKHCDGCYLATMKPIDTGDRIWLTDVCGELLVEFDVLSEVRPEAWPMLVSLLRVKGSRLTEALRSLSQFKVLAPFLKDKATVHAQQVGAVFAFGRLGPRAEKASSEIVKLFDQPENALAAMIALRHVQPTDETHILQLTNVLRISGSPGQSLPWLHSAALLTLGSFGARASGATNILTNCLAASSNDLIQGAAAVALAQIGARSDAVIPFVVSHLARTNASV